MPVKKPFKLPNYKTYDTSEGLGSPSDWRKSFNKRMGFDEAIGILQDNDPYSILGIPKGSLWGDIKKAYRKLIVLNHPDKHPDEEKKYTEITQKIVAAYIVLEKRLGK